jgi:hypothetical protein
MSGCGNRVLGLGWLLVLMALVGGGGIVLAQGSAGRRVAPRSLTARDHLAAEQRLAELGYWTGKVDGRWDGTSRQALIAFQKVEGRKRTGSLQGGDYDRLMVSSRPAALAAGAAHIEVDLVRQVLFIVEADGTVKTILPISSGSGRQFVSQGWARSALTHPGWYTVDKKTPGWNKSPLGLLYYPVYFMWGTAIHGSPSVPAWPDSHGCVRIPMFAARRIYESTAIGTLVIVHRGALPPKPPAIMMPIVESVVERAAARR